jgi:predicted dehydrogenase
VTTQARPTTVLILGTGSIGRRHLELFRAMPGVRAIAVPTRPARAAELRAEGFDSCESLAEALALAPDGAVIATDTGRHVEDALGCLERCPVLVEKPLAVDADGGRRIVAAARDRARMAFVGCNLRLDEGLVWLRARLPAIGRIDTADAECLSWLPDWRPTRSHVDGYAARVGEGGVLRDLIHELDYLHWMLGPMARVSATLENRGLLGLPPGVEETAWLWLITRSGVRASLRLSYAVRPTSRRLRIFGERGMLEWDLIQRRARHCDTRGDEVASHTWAGVADTYRTQATAFVAALRSGDPGPLVAADEGVATLAIADAARASGGGFVEVT